MKRTNRLHQTTHLAHALALGLVTSTIFLTGSAQAQTTIAAGTTVTVTDPATYYAGAGTLTIDDTATLSNSPSSQSAPPTGYVIPNALIFTGNAGSIFLRFQGNDTKWNFTGPITATATGNQIIDITTGAGGNGDREDVEFSTAVPDGSAGNIGFHVNFNTQSGANSYVNLSGANTFTGPITLVKGNNVQTGYLVIGGERYMKAFDSTLYTVPGTGSLGGGTYPGNISLGTQTALDFNTSANQTLSGVISGAGTVVKEIAASTLTLSGLNTYTGDTTVSAGTLTLASSGAMTFHLTDTTNNKITGAGTATLDGTFSIDTSAVTVVTGSWTLVNTTTKSYGGTFGLSGFTGPVGTVYKKLDGDKIWTFDTSTSVLSLTTSALITSLAYNGFAGIIDQSAWTIYLPVAFGTDLTTVAPTFTLTSGACTRTSGVAPSPSFSTGNTQVHYIVTDGEFVHDYTVTASLLPASPGGVGSGLMVWLEGNGVNPADPGEVRTSGANNYVKSWFDSSGHGHNASNSTEGDQPELIAGALNGKPVLRFTQRDDNNGSKLYLGDLSAQFAIPPSPAVVNSGTGGTSLNGTFVDSPIRGVAGALAGNSSTAVGFNGSTQYVDIPYEAQLNTTIFSAEIWANPVTLSQPSGTAAVMSSGQPAASNRTGWVLYLNGNLWSFRPFVNNGGTTITGSSTGINSAALTAVAGAWHHLVVVNDGTNCILYVNGVAAASAASATYVAATSGGTTIGKRYSSANNFDGSLDEAAFYTTALSPADVLAHYNNGLNASRSTPYQTLVGSNSPVGYYRLDEAAAPTTTATIYAVGTLNNDLQYSLFGNRTGNDERWVGGSLGEVTPGAFRGSRATLSGVYSQMPHIGSHIFTYESSTAAFNFLLDGSLIGTTTGDYNSGSGVNWIIGNNACGNGAQFDGDIAELLIYNRALTTEEAAQVGGYLTNKYGLSTAYPSNTTYSMWAARYPALNLTNSAASLGGDLSNFALYAFGLDPSNSTSRNPISEPLTTGGHFKYTQLANTGLTYTVWTSTDLAIWTQDTGAVQTPGTTVNEVTPVDVQLTATASGGKLFVRVAAQ